MFVVCCCIQFCVLHRAERQPRKRQLGAQLRPPSPDWTGPTLMLREGIGCTLRSGKASAHLDQIWCRLCVMLLSRIQSPQACGGRALPKRHGDVRTRRGRRMTPSGSRWPAGQPLMLVQGSSSILHTAGLRSVSRQARRHPLAHACHRGPCALLPSQAARCPTPSPATWPSSALAVPCPTCGTTCWPTPSPSTASASPRRVPRRLERRPARRRPMLRRQSRTRSSRCKQVHVLCPSADGDLCCWDRHSMAPGAAAACARMRPYLASRRALTGGQPPIRVGSTPPRPVSPALCSFPQPARRGGAGGACSAACGRPGHGGSRARRACSIHRHCLCQPQRRRPRQGGHAGGGSCCGGGGGCWGGGRGCHRRGGRG